MRAGTWLLPFVLMVGTMACAAGQNMGPEAGPIVQFLKTPVLLHEPVYAEILDANAVPGWSSVRDNPRRQQGMFEVRAKDEKVWRGCVTAIDESVGIRNAGEGPDATLLGPFLIDSCKLDAPGLYELRWGRGQGAKLVVLPVPASERAGEELLQGKPITLALASSVYAGYILVKPILSEAFGPEFQVRNRRSYAQLINESSGRLREEQEANFKREAARYTESMALLKAHLLAHPEFIFADYARLDLSSSMVFLGRCDEAELELRKVNGASMSELVKKYLRQLQIAKAERNSVCREGDSTPGSRG
jgi:hypothetical protein